MFANNFKLLSRTFILIVCSRVIVGFGDYDTPEMRFYSRGERANLVRKRSFATAQQSNVTLFRVKELEMHNILRKKHGSPPLVLDPKLNEEAQKFAERNAAKGWSKHSCEFLECAYYAENIARFSSSTRPAPMDEEAAKLSTTSWYKEIKKYNFEHPKVTDYNKWKHFITMIWKSTEKIGIGIAYGDYMSQKDHWMQNAVYIVCLYSPGPGYDLTEAALKSNVLAPLSP